MNFVTRKICYTSNVNVDIQLITYTFGVHFTRNNGTKILRTVADLDFLSQFRDVIVRDLINNGTLKQGLLN